MCFSAYKHLRGADFCIKLEICSKTAKRQTVRPRRVLCVRDDVSLHGDRAETSALVQFTAGLQITEFKRKKTDSGLRDISQINPSVASCTDNIYRLSPQPLPHWLLSACPALRVSHNATAKLSGAVLRDLKGNDGEWNGRRVSKVFLQYRLIKTWRVPSFSCSFRYFVSFTVTGMFERFGL